MKEFTSYTFHLLRKMINPIKLDCKDLRESRQKSNNEKVLRLLNNINTTRYELNAICNMKELTRSLEDLSLTFEEFMLECRKNIHFAKISAAHISKNASRQGTIDEHFLLEKCNETTEQCGVNIINLSTTDARPTKCGKILNKEEYKKSGLKKNDCLKSFDAQITGKVNGWIFAKITYTNGGHQDNVFEEAHNMGEWIVKYGNIHELYVILIDTDLFTQFNELYEKYNKNNILVVNHINLQQYIIDK